MNKWGVRLISCYFFIWAISDVYKLISGTRHAKGFLGFHLTYHGENINIDSMAWAGVVILVYAAFQLLRFHPSGRYWALTVLWVSTLLSGFSFIWLIVLLANAFYNGTGIDFSNPKWLGEDSRPIAALLLFVGAFLFYFISVYFLMRKDVKQLFQKPVTTGETN